MVGLFCRSNRGYTLIELLITISILAVLIVPFITLFTTSHLSIANSGRQSKAVNLCRGQAEMLRSAGYEFLLQEYIPAGGSTAIIVEDALPGNEMFTRITRIEPLKIDFAGDEPFAIELLKIEIEVTWEVKGVEQRESLVTLLGPRS